MKNTFGVIYLWIRTYKSININHLLGKFSNFSSFTDMLSKEVSGTDVNEAKVPDDPVGDGAFAGTRCADNQ